MISRKRKNPGSHRKTVVAEGELLTMDDVEAHDLDFSRASVTDLEQALALLGHETIL